VPRRAFGPDHPALPAGLRDAGQPVLIGGTMATASYILAGTRQGIGWLMDQLVTGQGAA
jgi:tRNA-splicing ligase RtcB